MSARTGAHLLIHAMYTDEGVDAVNAALKGGIEKVVLRACA